MRLLDVKPRSSDGVRGAQRAVECSGPADWRSAANPHDAAEHLTGRGNTHGSSTTAPSAWTACACPTYAGSSGVPWAMTGSRRRTTRRSVYVSAACTNDRHSRSCIPCLSQSTSCAQRHHPSEITTLSQERRQQGIEWHSHGGQERKVNLQNTARPAPR
jgi:hypothetical protein